MACGEHRSAGVGFTPTRPELSRPVAGTTAEAAAHRDAGRRVERNVRAALARAAVAVDCRAAVARGGVDGESIFGRSPRGCTMNAIERLDAYLDALRRRLRTHIYVRGTVLVAGAVLFAVIVFSWLLQRSGFDAAFAFAGRVLIGIAVAAIAIAGVWIPLRVLRKEDGARVFERKLPQQQGRLSTYLDTRRVAHARSPLVELLAEDAVDVAKRTPVDAVVPAHKIRLNAIAALLALCALGALLTVAPREWSYTGRHLLFGAELPREIVPVRKILVRPGD